MPDSISPLPEGAPEPAPQAVPDPSVDDLAAAWRSIVRPFADLRSRWTAIARQLAISPAAVTALVSVDPDDPQPMRELAAILECDASYVTSLVDELEGAGLARRRPDTRDRRAKVVDLTDAGQRARALAEDALLAPPELVRALPAADRRALTAILRRASRTEPTAPLSPPTSSRRGPG